MFICLKCDSNDISGYMKVLENEVNIMLMLDYEIVSKDIEVAIAETEKNIVINVPISNMILTECEKGVRLKILSNHPNNLKRNSNFIIVFKSNQLILKMMDENTFNNYDNKKIENITNFLDFKKINLNSKDTVNELNKTVLKDVSNNNVDNLKNITEDLYVKIADNYVKDPILYEPEVVCDLNSTKVLKEPDLTPKIDSFFKDTTISLDIALKRAFINAILSFLPLYDSDSNLKNTFIFTKEDKKEIEFIKIKTKDLEYQDNIFLTLIKNMINELNFSKIATHIYLGIEKDSKESIAILFTLSKDDFNKVEGSIYTSDIRLLETGLNDEFHYIIYECLI